MSTSISLSALPIPPQAGALSGASLQLKLLAPLPPSASGQQLTVTSSSADGHLTLSTPDGQQVQATTTSLPPPQPGTRLALPNPLPPQFTTPPGSTAATPSLSAALVVRILAPTPSSNVQQPTSSPLPSSALPPTAAAAPLATAANSPGGSVSPLSAAISSPTATFFPQTNSTNEIINAINATFITNTQQKVPSGPLEISFTQTNLPLNQPSTLTLTSPTRGTLAPTATPQQAIEVELQSPTPLPLRQPLSLTLLPNRATPQAAPVAVLTAGVAATGRPAQPFTPPALSALHVLINPGGAAPVPVNTPLAARVTSAQPQPLPGPQGQTPQGLTGQFLRLATGHQAVLQSPTPIPVESTLVVEFPTVTGPAQVLQVQASTQHTPQPQTPTGSPAPTAAQTTQAPLPPGTVVEGTLTGTNQQGQPLLTVAQPQAFAGRTLAVNLPAALTGQLPAGTQLSARVEAGATSLATVLGLNLTPAAQRTLTLTHLAQQWPALSQGLQLLQGQSPQLAQSLMARLPQLSALLPGLFHFMEALRTNRPEEAFGREATTLLRAMGVTFTGDIQHLAQLHQPAPDSPWRGMLFPYVESPAEDPRQGGFFWRREKKDENPRSSTSTRFIMQMSLSQMGEVQLDGLVAYPEIWLKLRRATPPEEGFIAGLQALVSATLGQYGMSGGITVEVGSPFPVNPLAEMLQSSPAPLPTSA
ncbi:MAG: hypothetical protein GC129_03040 [Proteobacteria bacterium]|nr:hypothetical protein [Pseudomonadota bacterium]